MDFTIMKNCSLNRFYWIITFHPYLKWTRHVQITVIACLNKNGIISWPSDLIATKMKGIAYCTSYVHSLFFNI